MGSILDALYAGKYAATAATASRMAAPAAKDQGSPGPTPNSSVRMLRPAAKASGSPISGPHDDEQERLPQHHPEDHRPVRPERHPQAELRDAAADPVRDRSVEPQAWRAAAPGPPNIAVRRATIRSWITPRARRFSSGTTSTIGRRGSTRASVSRTVCASAPGAPAVLTSMSLSTSSGRRVGEHVGHVRRRDLEIDVARVFDDADDDLGVLADRVAVVPALPHRARPGKKRRAMLALTSVLRAPGARSSARKPRPSRILSPIVSK